MTFVARQFVCVVIRSGVGEQLLTVGPLISVAIGLRL